MFTTAVRRHGQNAFDGMVLFTVSSVVVGFTHVVLFFLFFRVARKLCVEMVKVRSCSTTGASGETALIVIQLTQTLLIVSWLLVTAYSARDPPMEPLGTCCCTWCKLWWPFTKFIGCVCDNVVTFRSIQILPNDTLGVVGHHPPGLPIDNICLTHDGAYLVTGSQDVCKFWCVDSIPTLPSPWPSGASQSSRGAAAREEGEADGWSKRKKRKRKMKHRQLPDPKDSSSDFFSDLCI